VTSAWAAFRRPTPLSERPQLGGLRNVRYPAFKSGMCFSTHLMNETASLLSD